MGILDVTWRKFLTILGGILTKMVVGSILGLQQPSSLLLVLLPATYLLFSF